MNDGTFSWMSTMLDSRLHDLPINRLIIPGSHDSGAYELYLHKGVAIDRTNRKENFWLKILPRGMQFLEKFSRTQSFNVYQQLMLGVRYLDLRIGLNPDDGLFYIVHNLYGPNIEMIFHQIRAFVEESPKEIIIIDVQHVWGIKSPLNYQYLLQLFVKNFKPYLIEQMASVPSLKQFWQKRKSIMLVWRASIPDKIVNDLDFSPLIWNPGQAFLNSPWPNTTNYSEMVYCVWTSLKNRSKTDQRLFVSQCVLTPNIDYIMRHPFSNIRTLAEESIECLPIFFHINQNNLSQWNPLTKRGNIFMFDFVDLPAFKMTIDGKTSTISLPGLIAYHNKWFADQLINQDD